MSHLTPVQSNVLAGLLAGKSVSAVARENDIHRSTIYAGRREHPYFNVALAEARSHHRTAIFDFVQDLAEQALETVAALLESEDNSLRLRAAQMILRVAGPAELPKDARSDLEFEMFANSVMAKESPSMPPPGAPQPAEVDTIRQNSTLSSQPSRNSRCACGSGLKFKRCCGLGRLEQTQSAAAAA